MTDKQQPEALELASVAESADLVGYPTAKKANAYYLCLLEDCATVIRLQHAELETLRAKLKTYEDLGDAADDVQLLRMGYAAARLEIESLRKEHADELAVAYMCGASREKELAAQQPGAAYAALSDAEIDRIVPALEPVSEDFPVEWALWKDRERIRNELRASHGQAPAGAYKDSTPDIHVGDSSFESWYADYVKEGTKGLKQHCRDAYAAGMGDPLVTTAPAAVALPEGWVPLVITHEGQYPEEIAYGPQRMMDRLDKWLRKYFDSVVAAKEQSAPAADLQEDQTQPWYDLAWKHGARRHTSFDGDELTELSFRPAQFDAFCAELAPAAGAVAPAAVAGASDSAIPGRLGYSTLMRLADENGLGPNNVSGKLQARIELYGRAVERAAIRAQQQLSSAPTTQPAPQQEARINGDSAAPKLRAMATNYPAGHQWDKLDAQTCIRGTLEIEALRSQTPKPSPAAQGDAPDTVRLDWLLWMLPGDALRRAVGELSDTSDAAEFRAAIDAARAQEGKSNG